MTGRGTNPVTARETVARFARWDGIVRTITITAADRSAPGDIHDPDLRAHRRYGASKAGSSSSAPTDISRVRHRSAERTPWMCTSRS
jgi:hypothetical protein